MENTTPVAVAVVAIVVAVIVPVVVAIVVENLFCVVGKFKLCPEVRLQRRNQIPEELCSRFWKCQSKLRDR